MNMKLSLLLGLGILALNSYETETSSVEQISSAVNEFDSSLRLLLIPNDNLIYSPASIFVALSMLLAGAGNPSDTRSQILSTLQLPANFNDFTPYKTFISGLQSQGSGSTVDLANKAYANKTLPLTDNYKNTLQNSFLSEIINVDFAGDPQGVMKQINDFVSQVTNGVIDPFLKQPLPGNTVLTLVNAIYFKGTWVKQFNKSLTTPEDFTSYDKTVKKIDMMQARDYFFYAHSDTLKAQIIKLPYSGNKVSMVVVLPDSGQDINSVDKKLTPAAMKVALRSLENQTVILSLPKFDLSTSIENLASNLMSLGMKDVFDPSKSDLSGISSVPLVVSAVIHVADISVDETGTEAAAATAVVITTTCAGCGPPNFTANRPFLYFIIRENTILFSGRIVKPPSQNQ